MAPHTAPDHDDFGGLHRDLPVLFGRRRLLGLLAGAGAGIVLVACGSGDDTSPTALDARDTGDSSAAGSPSPGGSAATGSSTASAAPTASTDGTAATDGELQEIPEETAGPYPADGTNGPNVLTESGVVRQDIRSSFGSASGTAAGIASTVRLTVLDASTGEPLPGAAVYLWHCDRAGDYSLYSVGAAEENYLRGVQETAADGTLSFTTIFPACYSGRWPHMHFEVYDDLASATSGRAAIATSQLALPQEVCDTVYATDGYEQSVRNLAQLSLATDGIFSDGVDQQLATVSGDPSAGYEISLTVPV